MRDVDDQIRESLGRLVDQGPDRNTDSLWNDLVARRRRRRVRKGALAALLVVVLAVGLFTWNRPDGGRTDVATRSGGPAPVERSGPGTTGSLRVERTRVVGNGPLVGGTERVVMEFNEPLPVDEVEYAADITSLDHANGIVFTTQGPATTHVCDSVHSVPEGAVGSVDLMIPADWFADDRAHAGPTPETVAAPAKFVVCGPHNGFIQYAVWAPLSADPADVTLTVSPDRTRLTILTASPRGPVPDPRPSQGGGRGAP